MAFFTLKKIKCYFHNKLMPLMALTCFFSCTEEFDLKLESEPVLVVDATITNSDEKYVRLTTTKSTFGPVRENEWNGYYIYDVDNLPVLDAVVVISDDSGVIDTLTLAPDTMLVKSAFDDSYYWDISVEPGVNGYYKVSKIEGIPGRTYYLDIDWNGHHYSAESKMPSPVKIDTITLGYDENVGKDGSTIPYIWFKDNPVEENYYLFWTSNGGAWGRTILSDKNMDSEYKGLNVFGGVGPKASDNCYWEFGAESGNKMYSITKEVYLYYESLINQICYDGGVYSPSPASPQTNIKGGALGVFKTATVDIYQPYH